MATMRRLFTLLLTTVLVAVFSTVVSTRPAAAADVTYSFSLLGPQLTKASSGATVRTTGGGSFDPTAHTVVASGSFTQFEASGAVVARGTRMATAFVSFQKFGGPNPGIQGGVLMITVTLFPESGGPLTGLPMSVTCLVNAPPSFTGAEGVTLADFTEATHGRTLFHLNN